MILKYIRNLKLLPKTNFAFSNDKKQQPKTKTKGAPKPSIERGKIVQIKDMNFNRIPQQYRKGVKANIESQRMLTPTESQLQSGVLKTIIEKQRSKLIQTINSYGIQTSNPQQPRVIFQKGQESKPVQKFYDILKSLTILVKISSVLSIINLAGFLVLMADSNFYYIGYFLGASINPSLIFLNGVTIGFNCAAWIIQQSLHLHLKQVTQQQIDLIKSSNLKVVQFGSILIQIMSLTYYLTNPDVFVVYPFLIGSTLLAQMHLIKNVASLSMGNFQKFKKQSWINWISSLTIGCLFLYITKYYGYSIQNKSPQSLTQNDSQIKRNLQKMKDGHSKFLQLLKFKDAQVIAGQKINKLVL